MPVSDKDFDEMLYDLLPKMYHKSDQEAQPIPLPLKRFLQVTSVGFEKVETEIDDLALLFNADLMKEEYIEPIGRMLGFEFPKGSTLEEKRRIISNLPTLYKLKGNDLVFDMIARLLFYKDAKTYTQWRHRGVDGHETTQLNIVLELVDGVVRDVGGKIERFNEIANFFRPVNVQFSWLMVFYYLDDYIRKEDNAQYFDHIHDIYENIKAESTVAEEFDLLMQMYEMKYDSDKVDDYFLLDTFILNYDEVYGKDIEEEEMLKIFMDDNLPGDISKLNDFFLNNHGIYPYRYILERYNSFKIIESFAQDVPMYVDNERYSKRWNGEGILNKSVPIILNGIRETFDHVYDVQEDELNKVFMEEAFSVVKDVTFNDKYDKVKSDFKFNLLNSNSPLNSFITSGFDDTDIYLSDGYHSNGKRVRIDESLFLGTARQSKLNQSGLRAEKNVVDISIRTTLEEDYEATIKVEEEITKLTGLVENEKFDRPLYDHPIVSTLNNGELGTFEINAFHDRNIIRTKCEDEGIKFRSDSVGMLNTMERLSSDFVLGTFRTNTVLVTTLYDDTRNIVRTDSETNRISEVLHDISERDMRDYSAGTINMSTLNAFTLMGIVDKMIADVNEGEDIASIDIYDEGGEIGYTKLNNMLLTSKVDRNTLKHSNEDSYGFNMGDDFEDEIIYL